MMNKVFLVGRITRDLELRQTASGHPYVFFTVAVNRLPSANGERVADFLPFRIRLFLDFNKLLNGIIGKASR